MTFGDGNYKVHGGKEEQRRKTSNIFEEGKGGKYLEKEKDETIWRRNIFGRHIPGG